MNIFQMHIGLVKYLLKEVPKYKKASKLIDFLKKVAIQYGKVMLGEYKRLFLLLDFDYQKQKKEFNKQQEIKKDLNRALKMLQFIDAKMQKAGKSRQERKIFWRDFFKNGMVRNEVFSDLAKEVNK